MPLLVRGRTPFLRAAKAVDVLIHARPARSGRLMPMLTKKDRTQRPAMLAAAGQANSGYLRRRARRCVERRRSKRCRVTSNKGVDLYAFNTAGQTAMHVAAGRGLDGCREVSSPIHGAKLDLTDKQGRTPPWTSRSELARQALARDWSTREHGCAVATTDERKWPHERNASVSVPGCGVARSGCRSAGISTSGCCRFRGNVKRLIKDGVYTEAQANCGQRDQHGSTCEHCHGVRSRRRYGT